MRIPRFADQTPPRVSDHGNEFYGHARGYDHVRGRVHAHGHDHVRDCGRARGHERVHDRARVDARVHVHDRADEYVHALARGRVGHAHVRQHDRAYVRVCVLHSWLHHPVK